MPIYEYDCPVCGRFEAVQKASEKPLKCDPDCAHKNCPKKAQRVMSAAAFHLKGTGWYKTDYASGSTSGGDSKKKKKESDASVPAAPAASTDKTEKKASDAKPGGCGTGCGCH